MCTNLLYYCDGHTIFAGFLFIGTMLDIGVWYYVKDLKIYDYDDEKSPPVDANSNTHIMSKTDKSIGMELKKRINS